MLPEPGFPDKAETPPLEKGVGQPLRHQPDRRPQGQENRGPKRRHTKIPPVGEEHRRHPPNKGNSDGRQEGKKDDHVEGLVKGGSRHGVLWPFIAELLP